MVIDFEDYTPECRALVGGKNASLAQLSVAGFPVPPGFAVTTEAFDPIWDERAPTPRLRPLSSRVVDAVAAAYHRLCERCGMVGVPVAVRSSATGEDSSKRSFAGAHDTFLGVRGVDDLLSHLVRCWSSLWTARAVSYRATTGLDEKIPAMSVGVQRMVRASAAGVALTLNPADGDRSQIAIDASWGLGQTVVAGDVTPDHYLVDKVVFEITRRRVSTKTVEHHLGPNGVSRKEVPPGRAASPCLTDHEVVSIARLARDVERHYGMPQDIEWALDTDAEPPAVVLLQARPETVWNRDRRPPRGPSADGVADIVATLCSPLHARDTRR